MKNRYTFGILGLLSLWLLSVSYTGGPGLFGGLAVTTAPGESGDFCAQPGCHPSGTFNQTTSIEVVDNMGNLISEYNPGAEYDVSVVITANTGTPNAYGFQMVALKDNDNTGTDSWTEDLPSSIHRVRLLNRDYVEHDGPMTGSNRFTLGWTAPATGTGDITFYAAGNAVNLNGSPSGDDADTTKLTIQEAVVSSLENLEDFISLSVYPNPTSDILKVDIVDDFKGELRIFSSIGRTLVAKNIQEGLTVLDVSEFSPGLYLLQIQSNNEFKPIIKRIIIQ